MAHVLVLTEEFLKRVLVGLGEIPSKFAHDVILDIEAQLTMAERGVEAHVALIEQHMAPAKAKLEAIVAAAKAEAEAEAEKIAAAAKLAAKDVADEFHE